MLGPLKCLLELRIKSATQPTTGKGIPLGHEHTAPGASQAKCRQTETGTQGGEVSCGQTNVLVCRKMFSKTHITPYNPVSSSSFLQGHQQTSCGAKCPRPVAEGFAVLQ